TNTTGDSSTTVFIDGLRCVTLCSRAADYSNEAPSGLRSPHQGSVSQFRPKRYIPQHDCLLEQVALLKHD
ncbi:hypothetical protein ABTC29_18410, partial [Acinetobacter baumannii]